MDKLYKNINKEEKRGIVLNNCHNICARFELSMNSMLYLAKLGMDYYTINSCWDDFVEYEDTIEILNIKNRFNPILVAAVKKRPELFKSDTTELVIKYIPLKAIKANAVTIYKRHSCDDSEFLKIDDEKVRLWEIAENNHRNLLKLEEAILKNANKNDLINLIGQLKKDIPKPMEKNSDPGIFIIPDDK